MSDQTDKLNTYLKNNPVRYTDGDSLLEQLYWCYTQSNRIEGPQLREQYKKVYQMLPKLSEEQFDEIFAGISGLLVINESLAFQAGVRVGLRLAVELLE